MPRSRTLLAVFVAVDRRRTCWPTPPAAAWPSCSTKPLLMPLLAAYLWRTTAERGARPDRLVLAALACATGGDVALLGDRHRLVHRRHGAASSPATLCYLAAFTRHGAAAALRRPPLLAVPLGYALLTVAALRLDVAGAGRRRAGGAGGRRTRSPWPRWPPPPPPRVGGSVSAPRSSSSPTC